MKRSLLCRLEKLEAEMTCQQRPFMRIGILRQLPADYKGERHVVIAGLGEMDGDRQWCDFEERPGLAPPGPRDPVGWLCLTETQLKMIGDPVEEGDET